MKTMFQRCLLFLILVLTPLLRAQNALDFDGADDKVDCGNDTSLRITGKLLSIEAWIFPTYWKTNVFDGNVVNKEYNTSNYGYMFRVGDGGKLNFAIGDGTWHELTTATGILSLNAWQHIAGTYDGKMMRLYLDGIAVDSVSASASINDATSTNMIIGGHTTYTRYYQGLIDEVRIWKKCLSETEINTRMKSEFCSRTPELRAYYKFNQGKPGQANTSVKKLADLSGYGNHGTLMSFGLSSSTSNWQRGKILNKDAVYDHDTVSVCDRYTGPSRKYTWTKSGDYTDTLSTAVMGCDSVIRIHLKIRKASASTMRVYACNSYISPSGKLVWVKSGTYTEKLVNAEKCDSVITVVLKIGGTRDTSKVTVCNQYKSPVGNRTYTSSGIYSDTMKGFMGCDSIFVTRLTVLKRSYTSRTEKACNAFMSPSGKYVYTKAGTYLDTIRNVAGCDSIMSIQVLIQRSESTIHVKACNSYTSPSGNFVWTTSGTYPDILVNTFGCDSQVTIHLVITKSSTSVIQASACRSYMSPDKKSTWSVSGVYNDTLPNNAGCDSIITVNFQLTPVNVNVSQATDILTAEEPAGSYQWLDCNKGMAAIAGETNRIFKARAIGHYAVAVFTGDCRDTSACYQVSKVTSVGSHPLRSFTIMPNPGSGKFDVILPETLLEVSVRIRDISGRLVYERAFTAMDHIAIELNEAGGLYFVELESGTSRLVRCLVIE